VGHGALVFSLCDTVSLFLVAPFIALEMFPLFVLVQVCPAFFSLCPDVLTALVV